MRALLLRALLALAALALGGAVALARLRRVPRPRFERVARYAGGRVELGRVVLARRGDAPGAGQLVGWSVVCAGREVIARLGAQPLAVDEPAGGGAVVRVRDGRRVARVSPGDCAVRWSDDDDAR